MSYSNYYMNLPLDLAGSRTKNRFRIELLWGISKLIDSYNKYDNYTVVFDFKCDIELHYDNGIDFYQVKTKNSGSHTKNSLMSRKKNSSSILGKLYALYIPNEKVKLAIVCNKHLKIDNREDLRSEICLGELNKDLLYDIKKRLKEELNIEEVNLDNVFYICDGIDLKNPQHALLGKLVESFQNIKNEEPNNPNSLYRLLSEAAQKKASYELKINNYKDVLSLKGISKVEFDKMLELHRKCSKRYVKLTKKYIDTLQPKIRRRYNKAFNDLLDNECSHELKILKISILEYIKKNEDKIIDEESFVNMLDPIFNNKFPLEYSQEFKNVFYLRIFYIYVEGGDA